MDVGAAAGESTQTRMEEEGGAQPTTSLHFAFTVTLLAALTLLILVSPRKKSLPPGPLAWPLVGNLPHLLFLLKKPQPLHSALASLSRNYGRDFLYLRLGSRQVVVASSPAAASLVLKTHDKVLSQRSIPASYQVPNYVENSIVWLSPQCDERWKNLRTLCRAELFSAGSLEAGAVRREEKVAEMVELLRGREGSEVEVWEFVFNLLLDLMGKTLCSIDLAREESRSDVKKDFLRGLELGNIPNLEDFFPSLLGGWDLQRLRTEVATILYKQFCFWEDVIRRRKDGAEEPNRKPDFLDALLRSGLDGFPLKAMLADLLMAGTEATSTAIEWALAELTRHPAVLKRLRDELDAAAAAGGGGGATIRESDLLRLPYLQACIKETMRLHPPTSLLLPHRASEACEMMGYEIPEGSFVLVNAWALGRDPDCWEDPLAFSPERFLVDPSRDFKGADMAFLPFGSGRRACPGMAMAIRVMSLAIGSVVHGLDWSLPEGVQPSDVSIEEKPSLVVRMKNPFLIVPRSRLLLHAAAP